MQNNAFLDEKCGYYNSTKSYLWNLIPDGPNVIMDLGCASGRLGEKLLELRKASELIGVELFEPAAKEAMKYYKVVHVGDIEEININYSRHFDVVICSDILEHLKEPSSVLKKMHGWLKDDGKLVCCIPNVRYWRVLRDLIIQGNWEYTSEGILDKTHLRFFTLRSFKKMLIDNSFVVVYEGVRIAGGPKHRIVNRLTFGIFKEFLGLQILICARKT
jgi:SAM-dependent methyltransferase